MMYYIYLCILILYIDNYVISNININIFNLFYLLSNIFLWNLQKIKKINILFCLYIIDK